MDPATTRLTLNSRGPLSLMALSFYQGTLVHLPFAIFEEGSTTALVEDFSNLETIHLEIRLGRTGGGPIIILPEEILASSLTDGLSLVDWNAGDDQHGTFVLTSEQMNQYVSAGVLECWITIYAMSTSGERIPLGAGTFQIYRNRASGVSAPAGEAIPTFVVVFTDDGAPFLKATYGNGSIGYTPLLSGLPT